MIKHGGALLLAAMSKNVDINKAAGTGISFASGGAMIGAEVAGIIGSICGAILLAIIGIVIIYLIKNSK
jgi:hypothetical protein